MQRKMLRLASSINREFLKTLFFKNIGLKSRRFIERSWYHLIMITFVRHTPAEYYSLEIVGFLITYELFFFSMGSCEIYTVAILEIN